MEAMALGHMTQHIHLYSNSWGPHDNGIVVDGPADVTRAVLESAVMHVSHMTSHTVSHDFT